MERCETICNGHVFFCLLILVLRFGNICMVCYLEEFANALDAVIQADPDMIEPINEKVTTSVICIKEDKTADSGCVFSLIFVNQSHALIPNSNHLRSLFLSPTQIQLGEA